MKFSCEKVLLLAAILTSSRAAAAKSPVPALEGLLIEAGGDSVKISGYDLKTGITTSVPADVSEPGSIVLHARLFCDIVRKLPGDVVTLASGTGYNVKIDCEMSEFEILGTPSADYPELPSVDWQNAITIGERDLKSMISQTNFAVSDNESRPIHTGALFEVAGGSLTIVAVDGFRLALRREKLELEKTPACSFVVPGSALGEVEKIAGDNDKDVMITLGSKHIMFTIGSTVLISRRLEGEFLNYKNSIPQVNKYKLDTSRRDLVDAVERVSLIISDKLKSPVRCVFGSGIVKLFSTSALGRASDECVISGDGEELEIGFNNKYLLEALKAAPADSVRIELSSGVTPCIITPVDGEQNFLYMILPVRLKAYEG